MNALNGTLTVQQYTFLNTKGTNVFVTDPDQVEVQDEPDTQFIRHGSRE